MKSEKLNYTYLVEVKMEGTKGVFETIAEGDDEDTVWQFFEDFYGDPVGDVDEEFEARWVVKATRKEPKDG